VRDVDIAFDIDEMKEYVIASSWGPFQRLTDGPD